MLFDVAGSLADDTDSPKADEYLRTRNFARARELCMRSVRNLMGDEVPGEGPVMVKAYMKAHPAILVELMGCYNRIARAYWEQNKDRNSAVVRVDHVSRVPPLTDHDLPGLRLV